MYMVLTITVRLEYIPKITVSEPSTSKFETNPPGTDQIPA